MVAMNKEGRNLMSAEQDLLPLAKDKTPEEVVTRNKKQLEAKEASECLLQVEEEQRQEGTGVRGNQHQTSTVQTTD